VGPANNGPIDLALSAANPFGCWGAQLMGGLERSDMLLAVAGGTLCRVFVGRPLSNTASISGWPKPGCGTYTS
jgi:hypothetical protein